MVLLLLCAAASGGASVGSAAADSHPPVTSASVLTVEGTYKSGSDTRYTTCRIEPTATTTTRSDESADDISLKTTIDCSTGNIAIAGNSTLYDAATLGVLAIASDFSPTQSTSTVTSSGSFVETQQYGRQKFYQAHIVLDISGSNGSLSGDGTHCTGNTTPRLECWISVTFPATSYRPEDSDPSVIAAPPTPYDDTQGDLTGYEEDSEAGAVAVDGANVPAVDGLGLVAGDPQLVDQVIAGQLSVAAAQTQAAATGADFHFCGLSFRRRITQPREFDYETHWGARINCAKQVAYMSFRSRLVFKHRDSNTIAYGNLIDKPDVKNQFSGGIVSFTFPPDLVVYVSGTVTFPPPKNPDFWAYGVAIDPGSGSLHHSECHRVGSTFSVSCDARSKPFTY